MKKMRLIEIGIGPHAKRIYVPALKEWGHALGATISLAVDLKENEQQVREYFDALGLQPDLLFIDPFKGHLPEWLDRQLTAHVSQHGIDGVIISTEPLCHYSYAKWALRLGLNVLMDKPITAREDVTSSLDQARKIEEDYLDLLRDYQDVQRHKKTIFTINVQRRYHPGFELVGDLLREIADKTDCPITAVTPCTVMASDLKVKKHPQPSPLPQRR